MIAVVRTGCWRYSRFRASQPCVSLRCRHHQTLTAPSSFDYPKIRDEILSVWLEEEAKNPKSTERQATYCNFSFHDGRKAYEKSNATWHWLDRELSSNLAGETGAVYIYKGALTALKWKSWASENHRREEALQFCEEHMKNEAQHLRMFTNIVHYTKQTRLLPVWRMAGWTLGFVPTLLGGNSALYVTVHSVETFVEEHFQEQIVPLKKSGRAPELLRLLQHCCEDEVHHKDDAAKKLLGYSRGEQFDAWWVGSWSIIVKSGSSVAAEIARRV